MSKMTDIADKQAEFKSLHSEFGLKLDSIDHHLGDMTNTVAALEGKLCEVKQDVLAHTKRIEKVEGRVAMAEDDLERTQAKLASATVL